MSHFWKNQDLRIVKSMAVGVPMRNFILYVTPLFAVGYGIFWICKVLA